MGFTRWLKRSNHRCINGLATALLLLGLGLLGERAFHFSYTLYRLNSVGQMGAAIVTDRHPHSAHTIAYSLDYRCNGVNGECQVPVDVYQASRMGRTLAICYDPDNPCCSWVSQAMPRLFWMVVFFDGSFCLMLAGVASFWISQKNRDQEATQ